VFSAEGGPGGGALPRFQPRPGGFGKRQTPVGATEAAAPAPAKSVPGNDNARNVSAISGGLASLDEVKGRNSHDVPTRLEQWLGREFRHVRDVPCETTLTVIGAITGFAAQNGIWEAEVRPGHKAIQEAFVVIETRSGETFFFGDLLNDILAAKDPAQLSVWKIVAGGARALGAGELPDVVPIFKHSAETVGTGSFGLPVLPDGHLPGILPRDALNRFWPEARRILSGNPDATAWAFDAAMAAQQLMLGMKDRIDPALAARVVMEAAVPMSRIDPMSVPKT
jgi:hypothetical protein